MQDNLQMIYPCKLGNLSSLIQGVKVSTKLLVDFLNMHMLSV